MSVPTAIIRSGDGFGLHDLRLIERPHVHVAFGGPCSAGDVAQPRGCQVEARLAVRECSYDTGSAANFFHDPLERIIGAGLGQQRSRAVARTAVSGSVKVPGWESWKTLASVTAYHSFGGEVGASNTSRYAALPPDTPRNPAPLPCAG